MKKVIQILLAGTIVVVPFAITVWVIWSLGTWLDKMGVNVYMFLRYGPESARPSSVAPPDLYGLGAAAVIAGIFLAGLLTRFWIFRYVLGLLERLIQRVPGVKTVYISMRDLLRLFGGDSRRMGRAVLYNPPGTSVSLLGILTNDHPEGLPPGGEQLVAIFLPFAYMIGGPMIYVPRKHVRELNVPVEVALKLSATAQIGASSGRDISASPSETAAAKGDEHRPKP